MIDENEKNGRNRELRGRSEEVRGREAIGENE